MTEYCLSFPVMRDAYGQDLDAQQAIELSHERRFRDTSPRTTKNPYDTSTSLGSFPQFEMSLMSSKVIEDIPHYPERSSQPPHENNAGRIQGSWNDTGTSEGRGITLYGERMLF